MFTKKHEPRAMCPRASPAMSLAPTCPGCGGPGLRPVADREPLSSVYLCPDCGWRGRLCALCLAGWANSRHHLVPHSRGGHDTRPFCMPCHRMVHATLTERQLERECATVEALRAHPVIRQFLAWRRERPGSDVPVRRGRWHQRFSYP